MNAPGPVLPQSLEGAATVGIMRTFKVYKLAAPAANFLEVQHTACRPG
ncbi:MAG: hypothetical protein ACYC35_24330 [Pirellulales bacterium]